MNDSWASNVTGPHSTLLASSSGVATCCSANYFFMHAYQTGIEQSQQSYFKRFVENGKKDKVVSVQKVFEAHIYGRSSESLWKVCIMRHLCINSRKFLCQIKIDFWSPFSCKVKKIGLVELTYRMNLYRRRLKGVRIFVLTVFHAESLSWCYI